MSVCYFFQDEHVIDIGADKGRNRNQNRINQSFLFLPESTFSGCN